MARVDKTQSAVGVVRAQLAADLVTGDLDKPIGVGYNTAGKLVKGAGNSGIIGVIVADKYSFKANSWVDVFVLADIAEVTGLAAGFTIWADGTTGALAVGIAVTGAIPAAGTGSTAGSRAIGFTTTADRLMVRL